jgi:hypothetical protein
MHETESDGPSRRLITGREPHPTGSIVCVKSDFRNVTWESMGSEMPLIPLAEVASPIRRLKSQPHRLDMKVVGGRSAILTFFPDFEFVVEARFLDALERGEPFWEAALRWQPKSGFFDWRTLIVETKRDKDRDPRLRQETRVSGVDLSQTCPHRTIEESHDVPKGASVSLPSVASRRPPQSSTLRSAVRPTAGRKALLLCPEVLK